jgi:hypothetical protein
MTKCLRPHDDFDEFTAFTLDPGPWTLHPEPYTLNPTPWTLHPGPYTLNPTPWTLHPGPYTLDPALCPLPPPTIAGAVDYVLGVGRALHPPHRVLMAGHHR